MSLLGTIGKDQALLVIERAAFPSGKADLAEIHAKLSHIKNLGQNDVYRWFLASSGSTEHSLPDVKLNLFYPCTEKHIKKYSPQELRMVTETPKIYHDNVRPYMQRMRDEGRLNWVFNILEGRAEQEDVLLRDSASGEGGANEGFILAPDLNWDRKTLSSLHLLAIVDRRDIWSLRDLRGQHVTWLKHMRQKILEATVKLYADLETDQLKLYVHCTWLVSFLLDLTDHLVDQPTYYHFHVHVVHVMCESTGTQAVGKAFGLENIISQLEAMSGNPNGSMADLSLTYFVGTASDLWHEIFLPIKKQSMA